MRSALALSPSQSRSRVELFRLLSEPERLQVLALCEAEELSVSELASLLQDSQPQMSRKVSALRDGGLLEARRDGTRLYVRTVTSDDAVLREALVEGRALCLADGSLAKIPAVVAARDEQSRAHFESVTAAAPTSSSAMPEHLAHAAALSLLLPGAELAIDVGTGDGVSIDVLAPLFSRVIAVERSQAQLARVAQRIADRGFAQVSLFSGSYDDAALIQRVDAAGGADVVFAGRMLHHASKPAQAVQAFARLLKRGGHLVVLDYLPHDVESLRLEHGDVWHGFGVDEVPQLMRDAGLTVIGDRPIPSFLHRVGPDASVQWHAWVARRPTPSPS